jgi:hypothetical protein
MTAEYLQKIGFNDIPKNSIEIKISLKESRDFKTRLWVMKQITYGYFWVMGWISKGVITGVLEI